MEGVEDSQDELPADLTAPLLGSRVGGNNNDSPYRPGSAIGVPSTVLEPPNVYRSRWRSIRVMYLTMFLGSVTFTITMSSLWPFLQVLHPGVEASFLGWVVASYSLGQLIASPFFGAWATKRKSSREPLIVSMTLTTLSNLFYTFLQSLPSDRQYYMILARGLIGFSAGNVAVVRSYVSGATTVKERTSSMANVSICQALGFILGPVIQAALVPIGYPGPVEDPEFHVDMYTAPGLFATLMAFVNLVLLIVVWREHHVYDDDVLSTVQTGRAQEEAGNLNGSASFKNKSKEHYKPDYVGVFSTIFLFFVVLFIFTVFETIGTPLTMHMYAWNKSEATLYQGIILGTCGAVSIGVFIIVKMLAKRYNERRLLLAGFVFCLCGYFIFIPWGHQLPPVYAKITNTSQPLHIPTGEEALMFAFKHVMYGNSPTEPSHHKAQAGPARTSHRNFIPGHDNHDYIRHFSISPVDVDTINKQTPMPYYLSAQVSKLSTSKERVINNSADALWTTQFNSQTTTVSTTVTTPSNTTHPPATVTTPSNTSTHLPATVTPSNNSTHAPATVTTPSNTSTHSPVTVTTPPNNSTHSPEGCPAQYEWCFHVPQIPLAQYLSASAFVAIGYPVCNLLTYTIYSKVLGPQPQGLWMGWLTASGSLARTVGPIFVSQIYDQFGPRITFGSSAAFILATIVFFLVVFRRLVPFSFKDRSLQTFGGSITAGR